MIRSAEPGAVLAFFIPPDHMEALATEEGLDRGREHRRVLLTNDPVLERSMLTLSACRVSVDEDEDRADAAARRLILRLTELAGGGTPDWHDDESLFDSRTLRHLVGIIDEQHRTEPSLSDMAVLVGLSPSHFAKKFRASTGLSLHRFANRRRIRAALEILKTSQSQPLAHVAHDLGFSSQSKFTSLFSSLTGMTPAKYRKQFRRTVG